MPEKPWFTDAELANPHDLADKPQRVQRMFSAIAPSYDLNNRLHSMGLDQLWRKRAVKAAKLQPSDIVLDVACGTGDLSLAFQRAGAAQVIGLDFTFEMLKYAQRKTSWRKARGGEWVREAGGGGGIGGGRGVGGAAKQLLGGVCADAMRLPLADASVNVVSIAFGIRNVADPALAISEFHRVLKPDGRLVILEFTRPPNPLVRWIYEFYFHRIMPVTAGWIAGKSEGHAYRYLPKSVSSFMDAGTMLDRMKAQGFVDVAGHRLTLGIAMIYVGRKP